MHAEDERVPFDVRLLGVLGREVGVEAARQVVAEDRGEDCDERDRGRREGEPESK